MARNILKCAYLHKMQYFFECFDCKCSWGSLGTISSIMLISITQRFINAHLTHTYSLHFGHGRPINLANINLAGKLQVKL